MDEDVEITDSPAIRAVNVLLFHWIQNEELGALVLDARDGLRAPVELESQWQTQLAELGSEPDEPLAPDCVERLAAMAGIRGRFSTRRQGGRFRLICQDRLWSFDVEIAPRGASAVVRKEDLMEAEFQRRFGCRPPELERVQGLFADDHAFRRTLEKVLYFHGAVLEPLQRRGMTRDDRILDLASGDGEMSLALALAGHRRITMVDLDAARLDRAARLVRELAGDDIELTATQGSAVDLEDDHDVLICFQTLEHLSDEGNYARASRSCQRRYLERVDRHIGKLVYFNAPNRWYPIDGHDTGKPGFHWLPMSIRSWLIARGVVENSWSGIAEPVTLDFLRRGLPHFRLVSRYYAFDDALDYMASYPPFDYMGRLYPQVRADHLPWKKRVIVRLSRMLGSRAHNLLPFLSVVLARR